MHTDSALIDNLPSPDSIHRELTAALRHVMILRQLLRAVKKTRSLQSDDALRDHEAIESEDVDAR